MISRTLCGGYQQAWAWVKLSRAERCDQCSTVQGQTYKGDQADQNVSEGWTGKAMPSERFISSRWAICKAMDHSL